MSVFDGIGSMISVGFWIICERLMQDLLFLIGFSIVLVQNATTKVIMFMIQDPIILEDLSIAMKSEGI